MPNILRLYRSKTPGRRPPAGKMDAEVFVNLSDMQVSVFSGGSAADYLAVRYWSSLATYAVSDYVIHAGVLYAAAVAISPGAWNQGQWNTVAIPTSGSGQYLPLSGGVLTGPLTLVGDPQPGKPLDAATKQYVDSKTGVIASYLPLTGGTITGPVTHTAGVSLGSAVAPGGPTDLSRHLKVYDAGYGLSVTSSSLNVVSNGNTNFWNAGANPLTITSARVIFNLPVQTTISVQETGQNTNAFIGFFNSAGTRIGYVGNVNESMYITSDQAGENFQFNTNGYVYCNGALYVTGYFQCGGMTNNGSETIAGNLQVNGQANINSYFTCGNLMRTTSGHVIAQGGGNPGCCAYNTVGYASTFFCDANGTMGWGDADGNGNAQNYRMSLDRSSNLGSLNAVTANYFHSAGSIQIDGSAQINGNLHANGTLSANGDVSPSGNSFAHGAFYCDNAGGGFFHRDVNGTLGCQLYCNTGNNVLSLVNNRTGFYLQHDQNGYFQAYCSGGGAFKPGTSTWYAWSDARIKTVLGPYKGGLAEICQIEPVEFVYKGNERTRRDGRSLNEEFARKRTKVVGYVADDIMKVMPETVFFQKGWIDDEEVDDLKGFDPGNITHALVNAVKELSAKVEKLTARVAELEATR